MATYRKQSLSVAPGQDPWLGFATEHLPEAASQVFPADAPVKTSSGLIAEWVSNADGALFGFAVSAGQNSATPPDLTEVVIWFSGLKVNANLLEAAAADHTLVAGDLDSSVDLLVAADLDGNGNRGWYFATPPGTPGTTDAARIDSFRHQGQGQVDPNFTNPAEAGDVNARVRGVVLVASTSFA